MADSERIDEVASPEYREALKEVCRSVDISLLRKQFTGAEYRRLVEQHLRKNRFPGLAILAATKAFDEVERVIAEEMIDEYNELGYGFAFWVRDCGEVLDEVVTTFKRRVLEAGGRPDDRGAFVLFQLITMSFAFHALEHKEFRRFIGIRQSWLFR